VNETQQIADDGLIVANRDQQSDVVTFTEATKGCSERVIFQDERRGERSSESADGVDVVNCRRPDGRSTLHHELNLRPLTGLRLATSRAISFVEAPE
jgi:hypothetical protein